MSTPTRFYHCFGIFLLKEEICTTSLVDVLQAVLNGADGTVFCYGQANLGEPTLVKTCSSALLQGMNMSLRIKRDT